MKALAFVLGLPVAWLLAYVFFVYPYDGSEDARSPWPVLAWYGGGVAAGAAALFVALALWAGAWPRD